MPSIQDYIVDHRDLDWSKILSDWLWLVPERLTVWIMNRFGDLFVVLEDGTIWMLDVGAGTFQGVADSRDDFSRKIDEEGQADDWLMIPLADSLMAAGIDLSKGCCYSYKVPPVLGGKYTVENTFVAPIDEHFGAYASIHEQLKDVPDGTEIRLNFMNEPSPNDPPSA